MPLTTTPPKSIAPAALTLEEQTEKDELDTVEAAIARLEGGTGAVSRSDISDLLSVAKFNLKQAKKGNKSKSNK